MTKRAPELSWALLTGEYLCIFEQQGQKNKKPVLPVSISFLFATHPSFLTLLVSVFLCFVLLRFFSFLSKYSLLFPPVHEKFLFFRGKFREKGKKKGTNVIAKKARIRRKKKRKGEEKKKRADYYLRSTT